MQARIGWMESKWTDVKGLRLHARVTANPVPADAPHVVLVHGIGISSRYFYPTAIRLAPEFRVSAPDLPGFGLSDKPEHVLNTHELSEALSDWMQTYGIESAAVIGNSYGCQIIADLAVRHPHLIDCMALVGPTTDPQGRSAAQQFFRWRQNDPQEPGAKKHLAWRDYIDCGLPRVWHTFMHSLEDHIESHLPHVQAPTLVIRGSLDPIVPQRWAEEAARLLPKGELTVIPGVHHTINFEAPLELVRVLTPFLKRNCRPGTKAISTGTYSTTLAV